MTGRLPLRLGMYARMNMLRTFVTPVHVGGVASSEITLAEVVKMSQLSPNYKTKFVGKWHIGMHDWTHGRHGLMPTRQGFDSYYGMPLNNVQTCGLGKYAGGSRSSSVANNVFGRLQTFLFKLQLGTLLPLNIAFFALAATLHFLSFPRLRRAAVVVILLFYLYSYIGLELSIVAPRGCFLYEDEKLLQQPGMLLLSPLPTPIHTQFYCWLG